MTCEKLYDRLLRRLCHTLDSSLTRKCMPYYITRLPFLFLNGPIPASSCLFSLFLNTNPKKKTVGVNGIRTRIVGSDDELADHLTTTRALLIYFGNRQWINWLVWRQTIKVGSKSFSRSSSASYSWQGSNFDLNGVVKETDAADKFKSEISAWKSSVSSYRCENDLDDGTNGKLNHQCLSV